MLPCKLECFGWTNSSYYGVCFGMPKDTVEVAAGFSTDRPVKAENGGAAEALPGGRVAQVLHVGSFDSIQEAYGRLMTWLTGLVRGYSE